MFRSCTVSTIRFFLFSGCLFASAALAIACDDENRCRIEAATLVQRGTTLLSKQADTANHWQSLSTGREGVITGASAAQKVIADKSAENTQVQSGNDATSFLKSVVNERNNTKVKMGDVFVHGNVKLSYFAAPFSARDI
eukprot:TRINITY_DN58230_c0_g1_i1.p1 TRINITY_DN58230_c0_g1~~TRINITY_DN58230_c0_g1_i1.p1  ORF type:complete len:139 (-),score=28.26 TRINITY_DN58230_c0_g1_i1:218-634(-)